MKKKLEEEWKATKMFAPRQAQFNENGVDVCIIPAKVKHTDSGTVTTSSAVRAVIKIGKDGKGYVPRNKNEEEVLFKKSQKVNDPYGIFEFKNRPLPPKLRAAENEIAKEREGRLSAEATLEKMQKQMKAAGFVMEDGEIVKR